MRSLYQLLLNFPLTTLAGLAIALLQTFIRSFYLGHIAWSLR